MEKSKSDFSNVISATKITIDQTLNVLQATQANPSEVDSLNSKSCLLKVFILFIFLIFIKVIFLSLIIYVL